MQALLQKSIKAFDCALVEAPRPELRDDDWVLGKVAYAGVCGSDIKMLESDAVGCQAEAHVITGHVGSGNPDASVDTSVDAGIDPDTLPPAPPHPAEAAVQQEQV